MAAAKSVVVGKLGAIRMFLSSGSVRYGNDAPQGPPAPPPPPANSTVRRAVPGITSRLMK